MCLGNPGQIVELPEAGDAARQGATVEVNGKRRVVDIQLLSDQDLVVGDWVLVHVGFAMQKIGEAEARLTLDQVDTMGREFDDEVVAMGTRLTSLRHDPAAGSDSSGLLNAASASRAGRA